MRARTRCWRSVASPAVKNLALLIDAFASVAATRPGWRLWIAGEGPERAALEARAKSAGLGERVAFLGFVAGDEKERVLARAAIGAAPSQRESFGVALLEMQAHGLACVASDTGGLSELAAGGRAARQVPPGDVAGAGARDRGTDGRSERAARAGRIGSPLRGRLRRGGRSPGATSASTDRLGAAELISGSNDGV